MNRENESRTPMMRELPEGERPREKLLASGAAALSNTELLAVLIATGTGKESAMGLASRILSCAGSLRGVCALDAHELSQIRGIGPAKACTIAAAVELGKRSASGAGQCRCIIGDPDTAASVFMPEMRWLKKEEFRVALLNVKRELIGTVTVSVGGISSSSAHPREVFSDAIKKGAYAVILVHNHPSGDPSPSGADIDLTERLCSSGKLLGIEVADHIIIGDGRYVSLRERGYIAAD